MTDQTPPSQPNVLPFKRAQDQAVHDEIKQAIDAINAEFFVIQVAGKTFIGSFEILPGTTHKTLVLRRDRDFLLWMDNHRTIICGPQGGNAKSVSLGKIWLQSPRRRQYAGVDLVPGGHEILPNGFLNLWRGWGVQPQKGAWPLMRDHIFGVLANGDSKADEYILKFTAWCLQNPDKIAEVALVFRGDKGSGKGVFVDAIRRIFGEHGVYIADQELITGRFKGHLRSCLFLFIDEAFWSGDKKGIGVLQALITQNVMHIEQKGVDALPWTNRLHIVIVTDRDWAVPAGAGERRYVVFEPSNYYSRTGAASDQERKEHFDALYDELNNGGIEAMMWDLMHWDIGRWHPRQVYETAALRKQQSLTMKPLEQWFDELLQEGTLALLPMRSILKVPTNCAHWSSLITDAERRVPRLKGKIGDSELRAFLTAQGGKRWRNEHGRGWEFLSLGEHRVRWGRKYGSREWENPNGDWS